jgi:hypothetical protein
MDVLRNRLHLLIDQLTDEDLKTLLPVLSNIYYDFYLLRAIQASQRTRNPGDALTRDEALRFLSLL